MPLAGRMQWVALKLWLGRVPGECFLGDRVRSCKDYMTRMYIWDIFICKEKVALASIFITTDNEREKQSPFFLWLHISCWTKRRNKIIFKARSGTKCSNGSIGLLPFLSPFPISLQTEIGVIGTPDVARGSSPVFGTWPSRSLMKWCGASQKASLQRTLPSRSAFKASQS